MRYVKDGTTVERFLRFLLKVGHKSENTENAILKFVTQLRNYVTFEEFINKTKKSIMGEYKFDMKRTKTKSLLPGKTRKNETKPQNEKDRLRRNVYYPVLDCIHVELKRSNWVILK